eukprot:642263-Prymnesium_polylepis.1
MSMLLIIELIVRRVQDLECDEPGAFMSPEELEALPRNRETGSLALRGRPRIVLADVATS